MAMVKNQCSHEEHTKQRNLASQSSVASSIWYGIFWAPEVAVMLCDIQRPLKDGENAQSSQITNCCHYRVARLSSGCCRMMVDGPTSPCALVGYPGKV